MALCEQCGSISIVRAQPDPLDRVVAFFTSKRPIVCRRCGWRGRRDWSDEDLRALMNYGAGGAEPDPSMTVLDREPKAFDLATLDHAHGATIQPQATETFEPTAVQRTRGRRRIRGDRQKRTRRREIIATVAATALVIFLVVLLAMTGSCSAGSDVR